MSPPLPSPERITFPPGALLAEPVRLPLLAHGEAWYALVKPAGMTVGATPLHPGAPDLVASLEAALRAGKPQLARLGILGAGVIHELDLDATGVVLLANTREAGARLRNALGSGQFTFVYDLLVEEPGPGPGPAEKRCDLPLAPHPSAPRMVASHRAGKRCSTVFRRMRGWGRYALWEARTAENRAHQVRLHAAESGLRLPGERLYARVRLVFLSALKRGYRGDRDAEKPLHGPLCLHLREVSFPAPDGSAVTLRAPRPRSFEAVLGSLERHAGIPEDGSARI